MNILNTEIIKNTQDIFWEEVPRISGAAPCPVLVLTAAYLPGSVEEDQLNAVLKAGCKLLEHQYYVVMLSDGERMGWKKLKEALQPKVVILFNVAPTQLGVASLFKLNEINNYDGCFWIPTLGLERISQDKELKGFLWNNSLKPLFVAKTHGDIV